MNNFEEKIVDYGVTIASISGIDTTPADLVLLAKDVGKIVFDPQMLSKPVNERAQVFASLRARLMDGLVAISEALLLQS